MKIIVTGLITMVSMASSGQERIPAFPRLPQRFVEDSRVVVISKPAKPAAVPKLSPSNNAKRVVTLPQDGMPCVIPADQHYNMPVATGKPLPNYPKDPGAIPNAKTKK